MLTLSSTNNFQPSAQTEMKDGFHVVTVAIERPSRKVLLATAGRQYFRPRLTSDLYFRPNYAANAVSVTE